MNKTKYLLTGFGGQLGREWVDHFTISGNSFQAFGSLDLDITNAKEVEKVISDVNPDIIINCAAYTKVDQAEDEKEQAFRVNADAPGYFAESAKKHGAKLVHFSTDYVFSGEIADKQSFPNGYPIDHPADPAGVYGKSKLAGEEAVRSVLNNHLIIRVSWLCGKHGHNFVKTMRKLSVERNELRVVADQFGSPSFADQVVLFTTKLLDSEARGTYHISSGGIINWFEFASEIVRLSGNKCIVHPISTDEYPTKARRPSFSKLDCQKTIEETGITPEDWKTGLQRLIYKL